jgi:2-C-methyl-D-erythritol 4-phosphate cytidylyltransferase/2-C-methyl-D-erythritol 2,4-cyclodiphosphate synthase
MSTKEPHIVALITAAGSGTRFGGSVPKQFLPLLGRPVVAWSWQTLKNHPAIADVFVVTQPGQSFCTLPHTVIGGITRQESVRLGLDAIAASGITPDYVLIHDAARPCLSHALITRLCDAVQVSDAVIPVVPIADSVKRITPDGIRSENRRDLFGVQTPQAFSFKSIRALHHDRADTECTDDAGLCEAAGITVTTVTGDRRNIKITHEPDFALAEEYIATARGDIRTGTGFDVHRLADIQGRPLVIGGVTIAHDRALDGHSDGDVALHAITDAILGAIAAGDIGQHFSPDDPRWKNADSAEFLRHAANMIAAMDGAISHIDLTIICEMPKIAPHSATIQSRIAQILDIPPSRVGVKATTTEKLGFTGRGEGIAAQAAATIRLPFPPSQQQEQTA